MEQIYDNLIDVICECPKKLTFNGKEYNIYPNTLGKCFLIDRLKSELGIDVQSLTNNPIKELCRVCINHKYEAQKLLAIATLYRRADLQYPDRINRRANEFDSIEVGDLATLLYTILSGDGLNDFIKHFGITRDDDNRRELARVKKESENGITFGGHSVYGALIDVVCERYGWTLDYVLWGISYSNLIMLIRDRHEVAHLSKEERKKARLKTGDVLSGDSKENIQKFKHMFKD